MLRGRDCARRRRSENTDHGASSAYLQNPVGSRYRGGRVRNDRREETPVTARRPKPLIHVYNSRPLRQLLCESQRLEMGQYSMSETPWLVPRRNIRLNLVCQLNHLLRRSRSCGSFSRLISSHIYGMRQAHGLSSPPSRTAVSAAAAVHNIHPSARARARVCVHS